MTYIPNRLKHSYLNNMTTRNTYRLLIWIIIILFATNLSMGLSFLYHKQKDLNKDQTEKGKVEMPAEQRTKFFNEQLGLNQDQLIIFRELNRNFNRSARGITFEMESLRIQMVQELGKESSNKEKLDSISGNIGKLHTELKNITINYYLGMKEVCNEDQKVKLNEIFMSLLKTKEEISLPRQGRRNRGVNR